MLTTLIGRLAQFLIALTSVRVMTTLLTPDELGKVALVVTTTAFFALFLVNPLGMFINRRLHSWKQAGVLKRYLHAYFGYLLVVSGAAGFAVVCVIRLDWLRIGMAPGVVMALVAGSLIFNTINQTLIPSLNLLGRTRSFVALTLGTLLASVGFSALFIWLGGASAERWLSGIIAGQALFSLWAYATFFEPQNSPATSPLLDRQRLRVMFAFCWPVAVAVGLSWAQMQGYRFLIAREGGLKELGLFAAGYGIAAAMLSAMEQILTTWFQPLFYREASSSDAVVHALAWQRYASAMLPLSVIGLFAVAAAAPDLVFLMLGPAFRGVAPYVVLGALAEWGRVVVGVFVLIAHHRLKTGLLVVPSALGTVITLTLIVALMRRHGLYVAPLAVAAGAVATCVFLHWSARSSGQGGELPWSQLVGASAVGAGVLALAHFARPTMQMLGPWAHAANLALVSLLLAPLASCHLAQAWRTR